MMAIILWLVTQLGGSIATCGATDNRQSLMLLFVTAANNGSSGNISHCLVGSSALARRFASSGTFVFVIVVCEQQRIIKVPSNVPGSGKGLLLIDRCEDTPEQVGEMTDDS